MRFGGPKPGRPKWAEDRSCEQEWASLYGKTYGKSSESASTPAEEMGRCMGKVYGKDSAMVPNLGNLIFGTLVRN
jgi:hypothetical protein